MGRAAPDSGSPRLRWGEDTAAPGEGGGGEGDIFPKSCPPESSIKAVQHVVLPRQRQARISKGRESLRLPVEGEPDQFWR